MRALDMRYVGQEHLVTIEVPVDNFERRDRDAIKRLFDQEHQLRYGTSVPGEAAEIASLRTAVTGILAKPRFERIARGGSEPAPRAHRRAFFGASFVETPAFDRDSLRAGQRIHGPALIEEHASTTVLMPDDAMEVDALGNLVIAIGSAS